MESNGWDAEISADCVKLVYPSIVSILFLHAMADINFIWVQHPCKHRCTFAQYGGGGGEGGGGGGLQHLQNQPREITGLRYRMGLE